MNTHEVAVGLLLLAGGILITLSPLWLVPPELLLVTITKTGTVLWAAGLACLIDAVARPDQPPARLLIGLLALAFAVSW